NGSVGEDVTAVLDEEGVVVTLVGIGAVVLGRSRRAVGNMLVGVDGADRAHVGLVARGAGRAFVEVHVENAVTEDLDGRRVGRVGVLDRAAAVLDFGEQDVLGRIEFVDALHRADVDTGPVLYVDTRLGDDRQ